MIERLVDEKMIRYGIAQLPSIANENINLENFFITFYYYYSSSVITSRANATPILWPFSILC